jgi:hypothetical protein
VRVLCWALTWHKREQANNSKANLLQALQKQQQQQQQQQQQ